MKRMRPIDASLFEEPEATKMERLRLEKRRLYTQITYDCHQARVNGDRVVCKLFPTLFGSQPLRKVLRGHSAQVCHKCKLYEGGE